MILAKANIPWYFILSSASAGQRLANLLRPILTFRYSSRKTENTVLTDGVWYFVWLPFYLTETKSFLPGAWQDMSSCLQKFLTCCFTSSESVWTGFSLSIGSSPASFCIADQWKSSLWTAFLWLGVFGSKACSIACWAVVVAFPKA